MSDGGTHIPLVIHGVCSRHGENCGYRVNFGPWRCTRCGFDLKPVTAE